MKALTSLLAVLLMLSSASLAQTSPAQTTAPAQRPPAAGDSPKPEAVSQPATSPSTAPSTDVATASADAAPTVPFAPGAKLLLEPMDTFEELLSQAIIKKKVPVVLVHDRAKADFIMSGDARVHKPGLMKGLFVDPHGTASFSIKDAHTGDVVYTDNLHQSGSMMTVGQIYLSEADACAKHLKKALTKK